MSDVKEAPEAAYTGTPPVMARDMTLRDAVAIAALQADIMHCGSSSIGHEADAARAYLYADAFMAERAKCEARP